MFCRSLFVHLYFSFDHCVVCSSSIYGFWLPLWYLQTLLKIKMLYVKVLVPKLIVARYFSRQKDLRAFQDHTGSRKAYVLHCRHFRNNNKRPESFPWYLSKIQFKYIQSNCSMLQLLFFCLQVARYFVWEPSRLVIVLLASDMYVCYTVCGLR